MENYAFIKVLIYIKTLPPDIDINVYSDIKFTQSLNKMFSLRQKIFLYIHYIPAVCLLASE